MKDIQINAGDIILMNSKAVGSFGIRFFTATAYSHVGYAVNSDVIIDSIPNKDKSQSIRVLHKKLIIENSKRIRVYKRSSELTQVELKKIEYEMFKLIFEDLKTSRYHKTLACYSAIPAIVRNISILLGSTFAASAIIFQDSNVELLSIAGFIFLVGSFGIQHVRRLTIQLAKKYPHNKFFSDIPGTFCSHLVRLIERKIDSPLSEVIESELLPRPKEIMTACKKLNMNWVEYIF
ncbi:hypothetical protein ACJO15_10495 [Vibrio parahaemolyticus]|uniref:hypothetical protein n=1 Tax=Vibrio parahaemolyticus TaxID=670 RepID=UPI00041D00BB|nr:hypothetical protein [Vibrio parahaemolyticus]MEA5296407.1 hypothetical protein [Vibrio parahaemolyticus]